MVEKSVHVLEEMRELNHGPLPWTDLFENIFENLQKLIHFDNPFIKDKSKAHSRFGHYFRLNLYADMLPGIPGASKIRFFFTNETVEFLH